MQHFHVEPHLREKVEHCALKKARDAWRNWKYVLHKKFVLKDLHPFSKYTMIENDEWTQFKAYRLSEDFVKKSIQQSDLQNKNKHLHAMGGGRILWQAASLGYRG